MPYQDHPVFEKPANPSSSILRYLDFTKFVSLVDRRELYFCRADLLGDRFEGSMSRANQRLRPEVYHDIPTEHLDRMAGVVRAFVAKTFVNCWTLADYESVALWRMYVGQTNGIAIRSTFARLTASFGDYPKSVFVGLVKYLDWETDWTPEGNSLYPFVHKRRGFDFEHEVRGVVQFMDSVDDHLDMRPRPEPGIYVPVDLEKLVSEVRIDPASGPWFTDLVASVLKRYGYDIPIRPSDLAGEPSY